MSLSALLAQFPRFSEYDPGATGEGSLDPLGFAAVADQIADRLAPGVRARMSQPRFVTLSAIGAFACQPISDEISSDGKTTFDIAFEWLTVESLVRYPDPKRLSGLPGSQKAQRAAKKKERLSAATYLAGPRVFGFTGVYRPFSLDAGVLGVDGLPGPAAERLIIQWEREQGLDGFVSGTSGSPGLRLRREIERECLSILRAAHVTAPQTGWLMKQLADTMAPKEAKAGERARLRDLITGGGHEVRVEITRLLLESMPTPAANQLEVLRGLLPRASHTTKTALNAAIAFENCATAIEYAFRRLLAYGVSLGRAFSVAQGADTPQLSDLSPELGRLTKQALDAVAALDESLAHRVAEGFAHFDRPLTPTAFVDALISRHQQVQEAKDKRMWIDPIRGKWVIRPQAPPQSLDLDDRFWTHPMRVNTLADFLRATA